MKLSENELGRLLDDALHSSDAPGAALGVLEGNRNAVAASGLANAATGAKATPETVFQIGSVTKAFTATLAMQLVDAGKLSLSDTLAECLPELAIADTSPANKITINHLLAHTSGLDGDRLVDTGRGDDYLARFVEQCRNPGMVHDPGAMFSYCNAGYILLGRIIEKLAGGCFDDILAERLLAPLGTVNGSTLPEKLMLERVAAGHAEQGGALVTLPIWPRSNTPSGSRLALTAFELLAFAQMHLARGASPNCETLLSAESTALMQAEHTAVFPNNRYSAWGMGWMRFDFGGEAIFGHDGGVAGSSSFLRILPERNAAIVLFVNGPGYRELYRSTVDTLLREITGTDHSRPELQPLTKATFDLAPYAGHYARQGLEAIVAPDGDSLSLHLGGEYGDPDSQPFKIAPVTSSLFVGLMPSLGVQIPVGFVDLDGAGRPSHIHVLDRAYPRRIEP